MQLIFGWSGSGGKEIRYAFTHPQFEHTVWGGLEDKDAGLLSYGELRRVIAKDVVQRYLAHLSSDVAIAHHANAPLGLVVWFHGRLLRQSATRLTPTEVLFSLDLPVLNKVPIDTLLKIRKNDGDAFQRFRDSLTKAVTERLRESSSDGGRLAEDIRRDVIEPELVRVSQRLASAERALSRKVGRVWSWEPHNRMRTAGWCSSTLSRHRWCGDTHKCGCQRGPEGHR
jgi:hypothetical protein